jgi:signal transduction histidine kinase
VLRLSASVGISVYPDDGTDAGTLIDRADAAMYRAKRDDEVNFAYHLETPGDVVRKSLLLASLQKPVARFELALAEHEHRHGQLREANEQLVLAALNAQVLQAAAERAQQRQMESLAVVAHELRNPLTPIRAAAALLGRPSTDEARLIRVKAMIERQVVHMSRLVEDLLDVSRVNTGKLRLQHEKVDMSKVIDAAIASCRPAMDTRLQRFAVHVPSEPIELYGDPVRLLQILSNVLDNASKYTPDGGEISLEVVLVGDSIRLTVADNGIGITAEALPHIFAPFVQDSHAVGFNGGGLGIGLTVVQELVDGHGGSVVATSAGSGHGSEFVIVLPRSGGASNVA